MTDLHRNPADLERPARPLAVPALAVLTAGGTPALIGLIFWSRSHWLYWALLAAALLVVGIAEMRRRRAVLPGAVAGLVSALITIAPFAAGLVRWDAAQYLPAALPVGCAGLVGCWAALCWLSRGGRGWPGALGWVGGCGTWPELGCSWPPAPAWAAATTAGTR